MAAGMAMDKFPVAWYSQKDTRPLDAQGAAATVLTARDSCLCCRSMAATLLKTQMDTTLAAVQGWSAGSDELELCVLPVPEASPRCECTVDAGLRVTCKVNNATPLQVV